MDHTRPDGRNCAVSRSFLAGKVIETKTQKELIMEAWDRLYPGDKEAEKQKRNEAIWAKEQVNRKARGLL